MRSSAIGLARPHPCANAGRRLKRRRPKFNHSILALATIEPGAYWRTTTCYPGIANNDENRSPMISTIAFASVGPNRVPLRWIEVTPELKTSLGLNRLGALTHETFDNSPIEKSGPSSDAVQQNLYLIHTTNSRIEFPQFPLEGDFLLDGVLDMEIGFDCLGVCFYEFGWPGDDPTTDDQWTVTNHRASDVTDDAGLDDKFAKSNTRRQATTSFVDQFHNFLRDSGALGGDGVLKVASKHRVRAVLLIEPPAPGGSSRMRLYADTVGSDED